MGILHIKDASGKFVKIPAIAGESAYEIAVKKGVFEGTEQEFAEALINKKDSLNEVSISDNQLILTTDKYQRVEMMNNVEIILPTVEDYTEIHLFFNTTDVYSITFPEGKYQTSPVIQANKSYEFIFTYVGEWLIGWVEYGTLEE